MQIPLNINSSQSPEISCAPLFDRKKENPKSQVGENPNS
jgi:hypothetical protein